MELTIENLAEALQDAWNDYCVDTGCYPGFIEVVSETEPAVYAIFKRDSNFLLSVKNKLEKLSKNDSTTPQSVQCMEDGCKKDAIVHLCSLHYYENCMP